MPFTENKGSNHPTHIYAATKKCNEMMAHSYSYLYNLPTTGLRFLQYMALGEDQIWLYLNLLKIFY